jgi:hypothetical protein
VLRWLAGWEDQASGVLATGGALVNRIISDFGADQNQLVSQRIIDMKGEGYVTFTDPAAHLPQLAAPERLGMGSELRLTMVGRDRVDQHDGPMNVTVHQNINAVNAQVAGGDITNYVSFTAFLDDVQRKLDDLEGVDDDSRNEAQGILDKLRAASGNAATSAMGSGGGAILAELFKHLLGWHS